MTNETEKKRGPTLGELAEEWVAASRESAIAVEEFNQASKRSAECAMRLTRIENLLMAGMSGTAEMRIFNTNWGYVSVRRSHGVVLVTKEEA